MIDVEQLPCLGCLEPQAMDVRHLITTGAIWEPCNQSPGGLPLVCCRIRFAGVAPTDSRPPLSNERRP
jgi:hypothetical protein